MAANTVRKVHFIFRAAFERAVRWRYLGVNEAELAEPPAFERSDPDPPSGAEAAAILNKASRDASWCLLLWLTMITGSRRGEICAFRWTDLDLDSGLTSIEPRHSGTKEKSTKNRQKRRTALDAHTVALLRAQLEEFRSHCRHCISHSAQTPSYAPTTRPAPSRCTRAASPSAAGVALGRR